MSAEKTIKAQARVTLSNGWLKAIFGFVILMMAFMLYDTVYGIFSYLASDIKKSEEIYNIALYSVLYPLAAVIIFFLSPFINGYIRLFYRAGMTGSYDISDSFYYFKKGSYRRALKINISFVLRMLPPSAIALIPPIAFSLIFERSGIDSELIPAVTTALYVMSYIIIALWGVRYITVFTLDCEYDNMTVGELFRYSKMIMSNRTGMTVSLILSFIPWILLCLTALPILYVAPYMTQSLCISAKWMTQVQFCQYQR